MEVLRQEVVDSVNLLDERRGILHVRRHLAASPLFKGIPNFRNTRIAMLRAETKEELFRIFEEITSQRKENPEVYSTIDHNLHPQTLIPADGDYLFQNTEVYSNFLLKHRLCKPLLKHPGHNHIQ